MATDLLTQYTEAADVDFRNRLVQALAKKSAQELNSTAPTDPEYGRYLKLARHALNQDQAGVTFCARALVANGITGASTDAEIQTNVDTYFDALAKSFDPDIV